MSDTIKVIVDADLEDLVPGFLENRNKDVANLKTLLDAEDWPGLRRVGHSMKGVGGGYGFDAITDFGATIEKAALAEDGGAIASTVASLGDYLARVEVVYEE